MASGHSAFTAAHSPDVSARADANADVDADDDEDKHPDDVVIKRFVILVHARALVGHLFRFHCIGPLRCFFKEAAVHVLDTSIGSRYMHPSSKLPPLISTAQV